MLRAKGAFFDCKIVTDGNDLRCKRLLTEQSFESCLHLSSDANTNSISQTTKQAPNIRGQEETGYDHGS